MSQFQIYLAIVAAPLATMVTVLVGVLLNNSVMNAHVRRLDEKIESKADVMDAHLRRVEDMLLGKFAELDTRLTRIESEPSLTRRLLAREPVQPPQHRILNPFRFIV